MNEKINEYVKLCVFGKDIFNDYYGESNRSGYMHDKRTHDVARSQCKNILARLGDITEAEFIQAARYAWSGRIELVNGNIEYTAGQFYNIEKPQAMAEVLSVIEKNRN